ncbi:CshA/CshB family fibrillar adhesin-related protein [Streptococcus infantis]|uniref:CshA/CshB family fibrillar adhesin-related protein n=1 Tax=Streptococcus infantis TaxID=68892 RepID=UPI00248193B7|nr:CshA/CshB family fibrillar adhesin-related protein [Streptococcus infantis]MDH9150580.1 CshA/CshB family fibrillar adhesin-related protein [Streptococcus infantis]
MKNDLFNDRISRFSIRKLHVGVCSVLLGTLVMLGTATGVGADEVTEEKQADGVAATTVVDKAEAPVTTEAAPAKEVTYKAEAAPAVSTEVKPELNSDKLAAYVAEIEANVANGKYSNKTDESVEVLKVGLANAKNALTSATSQAELDAAYQSLVTIVNSKLKNKEKAVAEEKVAATEKTEATTGKPAENTKPAEGTNAIANTGKNDPRNGKEIDKNTAFRADTATATGIGADVVDATSTPKVEKPGYTTDLDAKSLTSQITWLDFGDVANWTGTTTTLVPAAETKPTENLQEKMALQVGATYTKEIMPGYVVTIKVKSLKPFQATEIYKKRLENQGATDAEKATYDPNARNGFVNNSSSPTSKLHFNNGDEAMITAEPQNGYTEIRHEGIDTKAKKTTIASAINGGNIGVQFEISATFRGKTVKPAIVMADGESANPGEFVMFTTNGEGWQHLGEWKKDYKSDSVPYMIQDTDNLFGPNPTTTINGKSFYGINLNQLRGSTLVGPDKKPVAWKYFGNPDQVTGGLGTGVFGPNISAGVSSVPLVMTRGASEVGLYIASGGKQSAMLGFFPLDEGDAPESYGKAVHTIATVDGVTGAKVNQPYLGNVSPDMDENTTLDWFGDDKATTADEGIDQLLPDELKGTTNEMIKMDRTRPGNYKMSVQAHLDGASEAHIYGWVDFNQNGKFDEDERSNLAKVTQDGTVELTFANSKTYIDPSVNELGARVRIAKKANEIESPTGMAFSGEVEDFRTQITHPPKGEFKETSGLQGAKQTATVTFTARGEHKYQHNSQAVIDETVEPYIVDKDGNRATLDAEGYYVVPGQGKYKITANGKDVDVEFIPEDNFLGTADGISIRRVDNNGYDTGWSTKFPDQEANVDGQLNTMDGLYIPTVTPIEIEGVDKTSTDVQGATQTGTPTFNTTATNANGDKIAISPSAEYPAKLVDPATGLTTDATSVTVAGEGTYTINPTTGEVTFTPEPSFVGTAKGIDVTLSAPVGRNKDGKVQEEYIKTATAKYTPTVTPITITPTDKVSEDIQNVPQTQTPTFELSNDKTAKITSKKLVDPATGQPTDETTVTVPGEGTYTIDPTTGAVTFTPEPDFVGKAKGVKVQATATITNGKGETSTITAEASYTPTVKSAAPTAKPATSKDIQGATQTGTPTFAGSTVTVNGEEKAITIKDNSYTLLDKDGNEVTTTTAYAEDGTTPIGTFTIDPATGTVTFTPTDKSYTGKVTPVKVQAESSNGIKVDTTYTPEIVPVTPTATPAETTDIQGATQKGKPEFKGGTVTVDGVEKTVPINEDVPATFEDGSTTKTVEGVGTYTVAPDGTVTFVPEKSFVGTAPSVTVVREDMNGTKASSTYTPTVTPVTPTAEDATSTDKQGQTQSGKPTFTPGNSNVPMDDDVPATFEDGSTTKTIPGEGTYTVAPDGTVTFVPEKSFTGTGTGVTVKRVDKNGTPVTAKYTPTVTPVTPTATPAESVAPQGVVQTGTVTFTEGDPVAPIDKDTITLLDENGKPAASVDAKSPDGKVIGTFTVDKETGVVTFTPTDKSYSGDVVPVKVQAKDANGTAVETTYTPKITPVVPTAEDATSTDKQGQTQTGKPKFTEGDPSIPMDDDVPATFEDGSTTKVIPGEGTYTVAPDGTVTFVPEKSFTGTGTGVTVKRVDKNGTPVTAKYTPTVTPVTPTATPAESVAPQGVVQTGTVTFTEGDPVAPIDKDTITLLDENGKPATSVVAKSPEGKVIGTFTVDKETGVVTFTPTDKSYSGDVVPVKVQAKDANGTAVETTYTPKITPVVPTGEDVTSTDKQGQTQTGKPKFTEGNPSVPMDDDVPATFEDGSTTKTIPGEGTYTVAPDGTVTFVPEKSFTGTGTGVTVKRVDKNGTPVTAKYTPTVTPITPTAEPVTSTDIQGQTQTGKPKFTEGDPSVPMDDDVPATFEDGSTTKVIPGEGTYTVAPDGTVTFVPEKSFTGTGTGVTVKRVDKNGTPVTAKYTPTVTPVTPTGEPATTIGPKGKEQSGKPTFKEGDSRVPMNDDVPATFEDGSTTKTIPGVGTYTVAPDGTVTFKPEPEFTGTAPSVTVVREDMNGTKASATYTPTVTPVTTFVDKDGKAIPGYPTEDGENPKKDIPGYRFVETKKLPNGDTEHVYEKVKTSHKDKDGNEIPGYPTEDGENPKKDIPGYRFVETKKLPNGDTVHVYEKITTTHVDENGNPIPGYPTEDGEQPKKDIPGYEFVKTVVDANGNIQHIYKKVVTPEKPEAPVKPAPAKENAPQLPNTGTEDHASLAALGLVGVLSGFGLIARKKKED